VIAKLAAAAALDIFHERARIIQLRAQLDDQRRQTAPGPGDFTYHHALAPLVSDETLEMELRITSGRCRFSGAPTVGRRSRAVIFPPRPVSPNT